MMQSLYRPSHRSARFQSGRQCYTHRPVRCPTWHSRDLSTPSFRIITDDVIPAEDENSPSTSGGARLVLYTRDGCPLCANLEQKLKVWTNINNIHLNSILKSSIFLLLLRLKLPCCCGEILEVPILNFFFLIADSHFPVRSSAQNAIDGAAFVPTASKLVNASLDVRDITTNPQWMQQFELIVPVLARVDQDGCETPIPRPPPKCTVDKLIRHLDNCLP